LLRDIAIDKKAGGSPVNVPVEVSESKIDQYIKRFVEIADYNQQDGSGVVSLFRSYHGGEWTLRILRGILRELHEPTIQLNISHPHEELVLFFEWLLEKHRKANDADFGYPYRDYSKLPL